MKRYTSKQAQHMADTREIKLSSARQPYETSYERELRGGPSSKVYPLPRDNTNILCFALAVIALGLLLLFGLIFVVGIGGTTGWASFAVACIAILIISGYRHHSNKNALGARLVSEPYEK